MEDNNGGAKFVYFLAGISIGALVGVLFAPRSGRETREYIAGRAEDGKELLRQQTRKLREQANEYVERGRGVINQQRDHLAAAIEAGKQAYRTESQSGSSID